VVDYYHDYFGALTNHSTSTLQFYNQDILDLLQSYKNLKVQTIIGLLGFIIFKGFYLA
jgi:hypothetical protein